MTIKFKKGIKTIHIPFFPEVGSFDQLYREILKRNLAYPKSTRRIEAEIKVCIDLRDGRTSYQMAQISLLK